MIKFLEKIAFVVLQNTPTLFGKNRDPSASFSSSVGFFNCFKPLIFSPSFAFRMLYCGFDRDCSNCCLYSSKEICGASTFSLFSSFPDTLLVKRCEILILVFNSQSLVLHIARFLCSLYDFRLCIMLKILLALNK